MPTLTAPPQVVALIQQTEPDREGFENWRATSDRDTIIHTPATRLIFLPERCDAEILKTLFDKRYPPPHPGFTRVGGRLPWPLHDGAMLRLMPDQRFMGSKEQLIDAAREMEYVRVEGNWTNYARGGDRYYRDDAIAEFLGDNGVYIRHHKERNQFEAVFNPKVTERRKRNPPKSSSDRAPMPVYVLMRATSEIYNEVRSLLPHLPYEYYGRRGYAGSYPSRCYASTYLDMVGLFNMFYGENAHRSLEHYREMRKQWKAKLEINHKRWLDRDSSLRDFVEWMDFECSRPLRKVRELNKQRAREKVDRYHPTAAKERCERAAARTRKQQKKGKTRAA